MTLTINFVVVLFRWSHLCFVLYASFYFQQCLHNSETDSTYNTRLRSINRMAPTKTRDPHQPMFYKIKKSYAKASGVPSHQEYHLPGAKFDGKPLQPDHRFLQVYNQGTAIFKELGLEKDLLEMDLPGLAKKVYSQVKEVDPNRTNLQLAIGFSNGENNRREEDEIHNHFGCAMNGINCVTADKVYIDLLVKVTALARKLGIPWASPENVECKIYQERNTIYAKLLNRDNSCEGVTIALLELAPNPSAVKEHKDISNDMVYTHTLVCNGITTIDGKLFRVSVIAYMRKACGDSMIRRAACKETVESTLSYVSQLTSGQVPSDDHQAFYESIGELGLGVISNQPSASSGLQVLGASLLTRPNLDKPMAYVSPVVACLLDIYETNPTMTREDLIDACLPIGQLNGVFSLLAVLQSMASTQRLHPQGPLGYLGLIVKGLVELTGGYASGGFPRAQVSWSTFEMDVQRTLQDLKFLRNLCHHSCEDPAAGTQYDVYCRQQLHKHTDAINANVHGVGLLGAQHLVCALAQLQLLKPVGMLHCARFVTSSLNLRGDGQRDNPAMIHYLNHGSTSPATREDRARRVMDSVVPHMVISRQLSYFNGACLENAYCELHRGKTAADFFPIGGSHFYLPPGSRTLKHIKPVLDIDSRNFGCLRGNAVPPPMRAGPRLQAEAGNHGVGVNAIKTKIPDTDRCPNRHCRVPARFLWCFDGLMQEIQSHFFPCKVAPVDPPQTWEWLSSHPILCPLICYFTKNPEPLKGEGPPKAKPSDFAYLAMDRFLGDLSVPPEGTGQAGGHGVSSRWQGRNSVPDPVSFTSKRFVVDFSIPIDNSKHMDEPNQPLNYHRLAMQKKAKREVKSNLPVYQPRPSNRLLEMPTLVPTQTFGYYRCSSPDQRSIVVSKSFGQFNSLKKVDMFRASSQATLTLGPLYSEALLALFPGVNHGDIPHALNRGCLKQDGCACDNTTHQLTVESSDHARYLRSSSQTFHKVRWAGHEMLPFFECGMCNLVDHLAAISGAVKATRRDGSGCVDWLFTSIPKARQHYLLCLILLGGKPQYFLRLLARIKGCIPKESKGHCVVKLVTPTIPGEPFMKVVMELSNPGLGSEGDFSVNDFALVLPRSDTASQDLPPCVFLDVWSWKAPAAMTMLVTALDNSVGSRRQSRAEKRRKRRENALNNTRMIAPFVVSTNNPEPTWSLSNTAII